jgi:hypothetical protein
MFATAKFTKSAALPTKKQYFAPIRNQLSKKACKKNKKMLKWLCM